MKLDAWRWLILVIKGIISALLFVFLGIGMLVVFHPEGHLNWQTSLQEFMQNDPVYLWLMIGSLTLLWVYLVHLFYEQMLLEHLTQGMERLVSQLKSTESDGLEDALLYRGKRLGAAALGVNNLFAAAQKAMHEEREIERSKDEMITNVSHDLRTPLTSILGYLGLIVNDEQQQISREQVEHYADTAFNKAQQMKSLVEDLFDYTQVRQVDFKLRWSPLDLAALLQQLAVSYELEAQHQDMVVSSMTNRETIEMVGDPDRLARVFMNLISNALKYGKGATFVRLSAKVIEDEVVVRVTNNGQKIPEEAVGRLFDRFYRVEESRNVATGGTGLGLAIVSSVVDAHGGAVKVESDDELTSFIVTLPLNYAKIEETTL